MEDREMLAEMINAVTVSDAEAFDPIYFGNPMLAKLMFDKFKQFLDNGYFTTLERQTMLIKFLESQTLVDLVKDTLSYVQKCEHKSDYTSIILEWTYHNSEDIIQTNLSKYDGTYFNLSKSQWEKLKREKKKSNKSDKDLTNLFDAITDKIIDSLHKSNNQNPPNENGGLDIG